MNEPNPSGGEAPLTDAAETPFVELLRAVPKSARYVFEEVNSSHYFPVGIYCHRAADEIERASPPARVPSTQPAEFWFAHDDDLRYVNRVLEAGRGATEEDQKAARDIIHKLRTTVRHLGTRAEAARVPEKAEPVAWLHIQGDYQEPSIRMLDEGEIARGWKQVQLYAAPVVTPQESPEPDVTGTAGLREALQALMDHCGDQGWWLEVHAIKVMDDARAALAGKEST